MSEKTERRATLSAAIRQAVDATFPYGLGVAKETLFKFAERAEELEAALETAEGRATMAEYGADYLAQRLRELKPDAVKYRFIRDHVLGLSVETVATTDTDFNGEHGEMEVVWLLTHAGEDTFRDLDEAVEKSRPAAEKADEERRRRAEALFKDISPFDG